MRVLHISSPKTWRGGEQQLIYLVEELKTLGVWQIVMCPFNSSVHKYCLKNHLNHITYYKGFSANPMVAFRVSHICQKDKIDLLHVHDSHAHNFAILSAILTKNTLPIIVSRRVDFPINGGPLSSFKYNHPRINKIICVSNAIKDIMMADVQDKSKLEVVHSGIDLSKFSSKKSTILREEFGIDDETLLIGNVAALAPHKNYPTFVRTAKRVINAGIKAKFFAIGEGPSRKVLESAITENGMENHIILTGFRNDISTILPELDIFLITSSTEGLGTSVLDAQAAGVPVVATAAGGIIEIIDNEKNGLIAPIENDEKLAEAVIKLAGDKTLRTLYSTAGKEKVKQFSKSITAKKTLEIYESVFRESRFKPEPE